MSLGTISQMHGQYMDEMAEIMFAAPPPASPPLAIPIRDREEEIFNIEAEIFSIEPGNCPRGQRSINYGDSL